MLCAGVIVPALPEKNVVQKYQMTTEFIEIRRRALAVYLNKVVWSCNMLKSMYERPIKAHLIDNQQLLVT